MDNFFNVVWQDVFVPQVSLIELFVRASLTYLILFALFRFFRRKMGAIGISDVLVVVLIATAAQNGICGEYKSITEACVLFGTILMWDRLFDYLEDRFEFFNNLLRPKPLLLVKNGRMLRQNMRQEFITQDELGSQMRQQGIDDLSCVKECYLEGDGAISVIKKDGDNTSEVNRSKKKKMLG